MSYRNSDQIIEHNSMDLQYPKDDDDVINVTVNENTKQKVVKCYFTKTNHDITTTPDIVDSIDTKCDICKNSIQIPYIKCADCCCHHICLKCFSKGAETQYHSNWHSYIIIHDNINVFPYTNWTAAEEKKLLNLIMLKGLGNWDDIAKRMETRNAEECRQHYFTCYFDGIFKKLLGLTNDVYFPQRIPYICKMKSIDPPRYDIDSIHFKNMSGYRAARGDFDIPYDNSAESLINEVELDDWPKEYEQLADELNCAIFRAYNHRVKERHRRYKIMRDHGLLVTNRNRAYLQKYAEALQTPQNMNKFGGGTGRFVAFMQITTGMQFDSLIESLQVFMDYKKYLFKLYDLRKNGITTFYGGKIYNKLKHERMIKVKSRKDQCENLINWKTLGPCIERFGNDIYPTIPLNAFNFVQKRRKATPLDIIEMPGYDQLTDDERNLCSRVRLTPKAYQEYKEIFRRENVKMGFLRLADARRLIKIDVNKTRQLYDFLVENGYINKPYN